MSTSDPAQVRAERQALLRSQGSADAAGYLLHLAYRLSQYVRSHEEELRGDRLRDYNDIFMTDRPPVPPLDLIAAACRAIGMTLDDFQ